MDVLDGISRVQKMADYSRQRRNRTDDGRRTSEAVAKCRTLNRKQLMRGNSMKAQDAVIDAILRKIMGKLSEHKRLNQSAPALEDEMDALLEDLLDAFGCRAK